MHPTVHPCTLSSVDWPGHSRPKQVSMQNIWCASTFLLALFSFARVVANTVPAMSCIGTLAGNAWVTQCVANAWCPAMRSHPPHTKTRTSWTVGCLPPHSSSGVKPPPQLRLQHMESVPPVSPISAPRAVWLIRSGLPLSPIQAPCLHLIGYQKVGNTPCLCPP